MAYEKGENGNKGLKRSKPIRDALCAILTRSPKDPLNDEPQNIAQQIAIDLIRDARDGDEPVKSKARSELMDRTEGKAPQAIIGGDDDDPPIKHALPQADADLITRYLQQKANP